MTAGSTCSGIQLDIPGGYAYNFVAVSLKDTLQSAFFNVRMANDFIVALTAYNDNYDPNTLYEIDIGGWGNQKSAIRYDSVAIVQDPSKYKSDEDSLTLRRYSNYFP